MPGNLITKNGRLAAVIDFDSAGLGDPSRDLIVAWMLLPASVRPAFKCATGVDDATWTTTGTASTRLCMTTPSLPFRKSLTTITPDS
jgi:aminoglycoside phosphotransferase (APT) family kinase protein